MAPDRPLRGRYWGGWGSRRTQGICPAAAQFPPMAASGFLLTVGRCTL